MRNKKKSKDNPCPGPGKETSCPCGDSHKEPEEFRPEPTKPHDDTLRYPDGKPVGRVWPR